MRKSILFSLLCLIAIVSVACGGGNATNGNKPANAPAGNSGTTDGTTADGTTPADTAPDAQAQWDALYKPGANWTYKMTGGMLQKTEVVEVKDGVAKIKTSMKMADADWMAPADGEAKRPAKEAAAADDKWKETGKGKETVKVGGTDVETNWVEGTYDGKKSKSWTSTKYGCIVKSEYEGAVTMELVELNAK